MITPKYVYLYKYLPPDEGSLKVISEQTIKFTHPKDFNDPFDCILDFSFNYLNKIYRNSRHIFEKLAPSERLIYINKIKRQPQTQNKHMPCGILCLSKDPLNILMWSHYSKYHTGFIVEFMLPKSTLENNIMYVWNADAIGKSVKYVREYQRKKDDYENLYIKSHQWEYEQEVRLINDNHNGILKYPPQNLVSVIAGCKIHQCYEEALKKVCQQTSNTLQKPIKLYHAQRQENSYLLKVPKHPRVNTIHNKFKNNATNKQF